MLFSKILTLVSGKKKSTSIWDVLLFKRRTFTSGESITVPSDKVLIMVSPDVQEGVEIEGELIVL
jgi:hypothetical protein